MQRIVLSFMVLVAIVSVASAQANPWYENLPCYTVTDLGPAMPGAYDLNANGMVVGQTERWNATLTGFAYSKGEIVPLPTPKGGTSSAQGVNNRGQIVGAATLPNGGWYPVMWQKGQPISLGLFGGTWGIAQDINDNGDIASCIDGRVVAWIKGQPVDLAIPNASFMWPAGINNRREIAATEYPSSGANAFLYRDGAWHLIDTPDGNTFANDINQRGEVCGQGSFGNGGHAFIYNGTNWVDFDPTSQWVWSKCTGLNDIGHAVGAFSGPLFNSHAFLRRDATEGMLDLNSLIPPDSGLTLDTADKINDRGQITAYATMQDGTHAILLTPKVWCSVR